MARDNEIVEDVRKLDFKPMYFVRAVDKHFKEIKFSRLHLVFIGRNNSCDSDTEEYRVLVYRPLTGLYYESVPVKMRVQYTQILDNSTEEIIEWSAEYDNFIRWLMDNHRSSPLLCCIKEFLNEHPKTEVLSVGRLTL
ncbi:hypothetical protein A2V49_03535 [candidate division WWE3 bacterium RBG_19FT_COMBO_34_6]|uniref:Uncharacterized protein n=1 Tax=candidate division WWE3 bacterium RBG_19FT_COMBO_34_6 TaxID=1802612 RepID=A0A1F4UPH5_UNCKA|nr:MAG: hypothetical protein A2V49_03535 [candidate division WWE3 bacterium RBG_19FT_COMBO_34_6]